MIHDLTGLIHTVAALLAMATGSVIFLRPKGGARHRQIGYVYTAAMVIMLITAFIIYRLTGGFNALHFAAILSSITLIIGLKFALFRTPTAGWYFYHFLWMSWSYVGLLAAFVAELSTRVAMPLVVEKFGPESRAVFWGIVSVASAAVIFAGGRLIHRHRPPPPA
jgi:uncharacterized membrane protein